MTFIKRYFLFATAVITLAQPCRAENRQNILVTDKSMQDVDFCMSFPYADGAGLQFCKSQAIAMAQMTLREMKEKIENAQSTTSGLFGLQYQSNDTIKADLVAISKSLKELRDALGAIALLSSRDGKPLGASLSTRLYNLNGHLQATIGGAARFGGDELVKKLELPNSFASSTYGGKKENMQDLQFHMRNGLSAITQMAVYISLVRDGYVSSTLKEDYAEDTDAFRYVAPSYTLGDNKIGTACYVDDVSEIFR